MNKLYASFIEWAMENMTETDQLAAHNTMMAGMLYGVWPDRHESSDEYQARLAYAIKDTGHE